MVYTGMFWQRWIGMGMYGYILVDMGIYSYCLVYLGINGLKLGSYVQSLLKAWIVGLSVYDTPNVQSTDAIPFST